MPEYIEREATCKNCLHVNVCQEVESLQCRKDFIWYQAESGCPHFKPSADVVEVVRCKDCVYYEANSCFNRQWDFESSTEIPLVRENDFCSYGERKDGTEK